MGYLDKQSRVIDVVLTERGRKLYSAGALDFAYFALFDDGIDYDPVASSGSYSDADREYQIELAPVLEAPSIPDVRGTVAALEPINHVFTAAPGYIEIPQMVLPQDGASVTLMADQRNEDGVYRRTGTSLAQIDMDVIGDTERGNPGFIVRVLSSGTDGHQALEFRRDLLGRRSYDPFIAATIDLEDQMERPSIAAPDSSRVAERFTPRKR